MGKRYFCDYCDRSFQDNLHNRKKHLNGVQHLRAKRVWYDLFRDAAAILQEEQSKKPCRKFLQTGQCDFGSNCRFSHMTEQDLEKLSAQVQGWDLKDFLCISLLGDPPILRVQSLTQQCLFQEENPRGEKINVDPLWHH
ncbi:zinc finger matrin-type protein 5 isoform X4 [Parus major]|uniref:zinc finger matrin-type protein 5 isoform X4 n=1 Tax=Parus major TaxID=9157 RepID=UPI0014439A89|nr:zinc finger matrin-type protein 5 isoform X4 [Parus major]